MVIKGVNTMFKKRNPIVVQPSYSPGELNQTYREQMAADSAFLADQIQVDADEFKKRAMEPEAIVDQDCSTISDRMAQLKSKLTGLTQAISILTNELTQVELSLSAYAAALETITKGLGDAFDRELAGGDDDE